MRPRQAGRHRPALRSPAFSYPQRECASRFEAGSGATVPFGSRAGAMDSPPALKYNRRACEPTARRCGVAAPAVGRAAGHRRKREGYERARCAGLGGGAGDRRRASGGSRRRQEAAFRAGRHGGGLGDHGKGIGYFDIPAHISWKGRFHPRPSDVAGPLGADRVGDPVGRKCLRQAGAPGAGRKVMRGRSDAAAGRSSSRESAPRGRGRTLGPGNSRAERRCRCYPDVR